MRYEGAGGKLLLLLNKIISTHVVTDSDEDAEPEPELSESSASSGRGGEGLGSSTSVVDNIMLSLDGNASRAESSDNDDAGERGFRINLR